MLRVLVFAMALAVVGCSSSPKFSADRSPASTGNLELPMKFTISDMQGKGTDSLKKMGSIKGTLIIKNDLQNLKMDESFPVLCRLESGEEYPMNASVTSAPGRISDVFARFILKIGERQLFRSGERAQLELQIPVQTLKDWAHKANNSFFRTRSTKERFDDIIEGEFNRIPQLYIASEFMDFRQENFRVPFSRGHYYFWIADNVHFQFEFDL